MSIQSNINQGISLMSMLASQTPQAEERRVARQIELNKPYREEQLAFDKQKHEERRTMLIGEAKTGYEGQKTTITPLKRIKTAEGEIGRLDLRSTKKFPGYISQREGALKFAKKLRELEPSEALQADIDTWTNEIAELKEAMGGQKKKSTSKADKVAEATAKAKEDLAVEQSRIAASNETTRGLDLSKLAEGPRSRVERAYKKAEKDTKYINKNTGGAN